MKIVVIGGTGIIGAKLVASLRQVGHEVLASSPRRALLTGLAARRSRRTTSRACDGQSYMPIQFWPP